MDEHLWIQLRYLSILGILNDCYKHVSEETKERIETAFNDAVKYNKNLTIRKSGNDLWIDINN